MSEGRPRRLRRRLTLAGLLAVALGLIAGGIAYATIPGSDGVITGCANNANGNLRVIDAEAGETCRARETQLTWSAEDRFASAVSARRETGPLARPLDTLDDLEGGGAAIHGFTEIASASLGSGSYLLFGQTTLTAGIDPVAGASERWGGECILTTTTGDAAGLIDESTEYAYPIEATHWNLQGYLAVPAGGVTVRLMCEPGVDAGSGGWGASDSTVIALAIPEVSHTAIP